MTNAKRGKTLLAIAIVACLAAAVVAAPAAYGFWYVHSEENVAQSGKGVIEVCCTVDASALGEAPRTEVAYLPEGSTAANLLSEVIESSNSQNGLDAIHDYSYSSLAELTANNTVTFTTYKAGSQEPGTHTTQDGEGIEGADTQLERFDNVVITVS